MHVASTRNVQVLTRACSGRRRGNGFKKVDIDEILGKGLCHEDGKALE